MKKTIAKIMAAAMVLSAVPAVAVPTIESQAAGNTTATVSTTLTNGGTTTAAADGTIAVKVNADYTLSTDEDYIAATKTSDGTVKLSVNTKAKDYAKSIIADIENGENAYTLTVKDDNSATVFTNTVTVGGDYSNGQYEAGIEAEEGDLATGDVFAKIDSKTALEIQILRGEEKDLDGNDDLRGELLNLNTINVGGVTFDVVKLGAQSLKKAHMKKFKAENVKRVGKGAFRNCKQVKNIDLQDSNKIRKINSKAFYGAKNLKTIIIDGRKLNTVGKNSFSGVKNGCTVKIRAKKSKYNSDVKMIKKNGGNSNLKFIRK